MQSDVPNSADSHRLPEQTARSSGRRFRLASAPAVAYSSAVLLAAALIALVAGCASARPFAWWPATPLNCVLPEDASVEQIVGQLNQNVVPSWRSTDVRLTVRQGSGIPVSLTAILAVKEPRQLRLIATNSFGNNEFDLGSNDERFWLWVRRAEPKSVLTASYEDLPQLSQRLQIPFQPVWLMEVLGVVRFEPERFSLERADRHRVRLISHERSLQGLPVRKEIVVDTCRGVATEHVLYDSGGHVLGRATLSEHQRDSLTGAVLPHRIDVEWPQAELKLKLRLGKIEVNPIGIADRIWQLPEYPDTEVVDLAQVLGPIRPVSGSQQQSPSSWREDTPPKWDGGSPAARSAWRSSNSGTVSNSVPRPPADQPPLGESVSESTPPSKPSMSMLEELSELKRVPQNQPASQPLKREASVQRHAPPLFEKSSESLDAWSNSRSAGQLSPTNQATSSAVPLWRKATAAGLQ